MSMEIIQSAATELLVNVALAVLALAGAYAVYYIRLGTSKLKAQTAQIEDASTRKVLDDALEVLLVLDGTTGQNGLIQAKQFKEIAGVTAIALTKLDGTAKGGIVIAVADALQIPVKFVGVGEQADDLMPFSAKEFVEALI